MVADEKKSIREALKRSGSLPALLEDLARSETADYAQLQRHVEEGPVHPSFDSLYDHVLGILDADEDLKVLNHLVMCGACLEEVLRIRSIEEGLNEAALERADRIPLLQRIKELISTQSLPLFLSQELMAVREAPNGPPKNTYTVGEQLVINAEAPEDGYLVVLDFCQETGNLALIFPRCVDETAMVPTGRKIRVSGHIEGPAGRHGFLAVWTRNQVLDFTGFDLTDEVGNQQAVEELLDSLEDLQEGEWLTSVHEYEVLAV
jgi:hypothetical protein